MVNRIIQKALKYSKEIRLKGKLKKNVLFYYLKFPNIYIHSYFRGVHNNRYASFLYAKAINELGYNIFAYDCDDVNIKERKYDIFLGHGPNFSKVAEKIKKKNNNCKTILLLTGSNPAFGNEQQRIRSLNLMKRRDINIPIYEENIVGDNSYNLAIADKILLLGNDFVLNTYPKQFHHKIVLHDNVSIFPARKKEGFLKRYIYMSSVGQVHRGLDLILETFENRREKIYLCSSFKEEKEFEENYKKQLYGIKNIIPVGYIKINTIKFHKIIEEVDFAVLPSCSEGQSSSIINLMMFGIIPIVTENTGIKNIEKIGYVIKGGTLEDVQEVIGRASNASIEEIEEKRNNLFAIAYRHQSEYLKILIKNTITSLE
jgi:hypothetical protein